MIKEEDTRNAGESTSIYIIPVISFAREDLT